METVRTPTRQPNLVAELNSLARRDQVALRTRVMELLQNSDPAVVMQFEAAMQSGRVDLGVVSMAIDCRHELTPRALRGQGRKLDETRRGVENLVVAMLKLAPSDQDLLDEESAGSEGEEPLPTGLASELYELLDLVGKEGVKQRVRAIFTRQGDDLRSLNESNALGAALDYFRREGKRDPSGKAAIILKIIEENFTI